MQKKNYQKFAPKGDKSYSAGEVQEIIKSEIANAVNEAKASWEKEAQSRIAAERDDAAKLASMSAEERARTELNRREAQFAEEKQQYMKERMEFEAAKTLADEQLPPCFAKILSGADSDATRENINLFKTEFLKAVESAINERLKGKTPRTSSVVESNDPFLTGFGM